MKRIFFFLILLTPYFCYPQVWKSFGADSLYVPGNPNSHVSEFKVINNKLYVGGAFTKSGILNYSGIAVWDSLQWDSLQSGVYGGGDVFSICSFQNKKYIGGSFFRAGNLTEFNSHYFACWNDTVWQSVGSIGSPNGPVEALSYKDMLYIGGGFGYIGSTYFECIAAWDGVQWHNVNNFDGTISAFEIYNNELYAGGFFTSVSGTPAYFIARYDGAQWHDVGGGLDGYVKFLKVDTVENVLYVGGAFFNTGDSTNVRFIAKWDGSHWHDVGGGFNRDVEAIDIYRGQLYAGGYFDTAGTQHIPYLAKFNGNNWEQVGSGVDNAVFAIAEYKDDLYVGGQFKHAGGLVSPCIAKWYIHPDSVFIDNGELKMENVPELKVYPNPTNGNIIVEFILPQRAKAFLKIYNSKGELFRKFVISENENLSAGQAGKKDIEASKWAKGVYYCVLEQKGKRLAWKKIVIE
ncbi:MAG: T9SS type A sorting domain-containing protein [Bacteroidia bacterium]|nr:T9SS type A sorting domain-containing protein [Bacteroidia bacterium]